MDELREVKLEDESEEDVEIQMTNDAPDVSIPKYTIVGTLKRKRVVSSEFANLNLAPSKNSQIFENPPKLEPRDNELVDDDSNSSFAPKPEPEEDHGHFLGLTSFFEPPPKLEPLDGVQESSSNLAPFFENLLENQIVKQEEEPYYPTSEQGASLSSNFAPKEPKEEPPEELFHRKHAGQMGTLDRCELCDRHQPHHELCEVDYRASKYLLAVASVLHAYRTPTQAMLFASGGVTARRVCATHLGSTVDVILERLKISSSDEQPRVDDVMNLMGVVNGIWENCTAPVFMNTFRWFARMYVVEPVMAAAPRTKPMPRVCRRTPHTPIPVLHVYPCIICPQKSSIVKKEKKAKLEVRDKKTRLVLVVGACLSEQMEAATAKKFMAGNATKLVCRAHFGSTIRRIREYLRIESLDETPAPELAQRVTSLVHSICSTNRIGYVEFIDIVAAFAEEYADLIDSPPPPPSSATTPNASMKPRFSSLE